MTAIQIVCRGVLALWGIFFALKMVTSKEHPWVRGFGMFLGFSQALMALGLN